MLRRDVVEGVHLVEDSYVNWYIVDDGAGALTVVDAGTPAGWGRLQEALSQLGRKLADIQALVLTHAHYDHVGFAERLRRELGIPVWLHENDVKLSKHPAFFGTEDLPLKYFKNRPFLGVAASFLRNRAFFARPLGDVSTYGGEGPLDVPGNPHVVFTPGHTKGHCSIHFPDRDLVIAGDAIVTWDPYTGQAGPRLVAKAATNDSAQATASLDKIARTGAGTVLVGHGDPWTGGAEEAARLAGERGAA
jgi:glyoxylase-like metal-dependent hydrolase (beta-lactamase superfamily II)